MVLLIPSFAAADPPAHAPAHGYRAKQQDRHEKSQQRARDRAPTRERRRGGVEVVYDSARGVRVAIGLPDVFYHGGFYYRQNDYSWEVSATGDRGWRFSVASEVPEQIRNAGRKPQPVPAAPAGPKGHHAGKR
jgi:hypothetical protein